MPTCTINKKFKVPQNSNYSGKYEFERRCDYKRENWEKDQIYEGEFFYDAIHGQGNYTWNNSGIYDGDFYSGSKEGYGFFSFPNNSFFQGLFVKNQPFGPGVLSHGDGCQDAGFWLGQKLVRLRRAVDLIVPRLASTAAAKRKLLQFQVPTQLNETQDDSVAEIIRQSFFLFDYVRIPYSKLSYDPRSFFFDKLLFDAMYFKNACDVQDKFWGENFIEGENESENGEEETDVERRPPSHCLCPNEVFVMQYEEREEKDHCEEKIVGMGKEIGFLGGHSEREKLKEVGDREMETKSADSKQIIEEFDEEDKKKTKEKSAKLNSWNKSEICTEMAKQILHFQPFQGKLNFNLAKLMVGAKHAIMKEMGEKERQCLQFLESCALGPPFLVKEYLCSYEMSEELMDSRGNNSLMFAAAMDQHEIMDLLLDYGVDVNAFNDENLTPLNLCLLRRLAETHNVFNWERAFLPPDDSIETAGDDLSISDGRSDESIDGFVGNMSFMPDRRALFNEDISASKKWDKNSWKKPSLYSYPNKDLSILSQITVLNVKKKLKGSTSRMGSMEELSGHPSGRMLHPKGELGATPSRFFKIDESDQQEKIDSYLFDLSPLTTPTLQNSKKQRGSVRMKKKNESNESLIDEKEESRIGLTERSKAIDKTIEKLLHRGADPNLSKVPRPSIHLGIFTKDLKIVYKLLVYGANPDSQLLHNEGLLTPLHVVALLKPAKEYADMCNILLKHGANPEVETTPEFRIYDEEKSFLDSSRGRTPLHLLCMRPDIENSEAQKFVLKIGTMLANAGNKENFYNGHSYLTLAMLCGNISLLQALLESKYFDPNVVLGEGLGTPLHVLVSTLLQMRTEYEKSLKMCDLLIAAGANPLKKFEAPEHLVGTCIDYGYREIETEKMNRKQHAHDKSGSKSHKPDERDHLKDHMRVVEYLKQIVMNKAANRSRRVSVSSKVRDFQTKASEKRGILRNSKGNSIINILASPDETSEPNKGVRRGKEEDSDSIDETSKHKKGGRKGKKEGLQDEAFATRRQSISQNVKFLKEKESEKRKGKSSNAVERSSKKPRAFKSSAKERKTPEDMKISNKHKTGTKQTSGKRDKKGTAIEEVKSQRKHLNKGEIDGLGKKGKAELYRELRKSGRKLRKPFSPGQFANINAEMPRGKLRHFFRSMFGSCVNFDDNGLLLPYVVLRDGDLYYRFDGKATGRKEQYSLV